jgi:hypothetical protein
MSKKYEQLYELANTKGNKLTVFENGSALITTPKHVQGIWVSSAIVAEWNKPAKKKKGKSK